MFRKRRALRTYENSRLIEQTEIQKERLDRQSQLIARSIEPSDDVLLQRKITESLYSFLIREAKHQHNK